MALALLALVGAYAVITAAGDRFSLGFADQPAAHQDHLWNFLALVLVGLAGAFAGGCPVRQMIMTGEGNGDAMVTVCGLVVGGALSHTLGLASSGKGTTPAGQAAILIGITLVLVYAWAITRSRED